MQAYDDFLLPINIRFGVNAFYTLPTEIKKMEPAKVIVISDRGIKNTGLVDKTVALV